MNDSRREVKISSTPLLPLTYTVQIVDDMLGSFNERVPKHAKRYANLGDIMKTAFVAYSEDVKSGSFPTKEHSFIIDNAVLDAMKAQYSATGRP